MPTTLQLSPWLGDPGTHPDLDVQWGPNTIGSDLLYHTQTQREAFAAYSQGVWQINDKFALTMGLRYARDELIAEENLWRYSETGGDSFIPAIFGSLAVMNMANGGFETDRKPGVRGQPLWGHLRSSTGSLRRLDWPSTAARPFCAEHLSAFRA